MMVRESFQFKEEEFLRSAYADYPAQQLGRERYKASVVGVKLTADEEAGLLDDFRCVARQMYFKACKSAGGSGRLAKIFGARSQDKEFDSLDARI
jgi:hypothetical protein